ncbi:isoleucine--tRNA ligase ISM1 [Rhodotorula paludigena]|uniref:isoleucine--tRNA ligase ISM1 n=1 Tax=Rhodotorula paludigena TaxID=86838 RepID=UPI003174DE33
MANRLPVRGAHRAAAAAARRPASAPVHPWTLCPPACSARSFASTTAHRAKPPKPKRAKDPLEHFYSESLNLPKTAFPLRAEATRREKLFWRRTIDELYHWQAEQKDRPLFVLHDGPPYANGHLHCGHALNKITKDLINRSKLIQGYRVHYTPGFDTHGLPLELKALSALKKPASSLSPQEIRAAARQEAEKGIEIQSGEFRSFGVMGDWDRPYKTMDWQYEKRQLQVVRDMVGKGLIVTHHRPTLYSPSSRTALAEAELEYREDHVSRSVYVSFPVAQLGAQLERELEVAGVAVKEDEKVSLAVWTTTAWTIPSNVAIAVSDSMEYTLARRADSPADLLIVASDRLSFLSELLSTSLEPLAHFRGSSLLATTYTDPLASSSTPASAYSQAIRPLIPASYVTSTTGTGLVHTAPAHGVEDWEAWRAYQLAQRSASPSASAASLPDTLCAVDAAGRLDGPTLREMGAQEDVVERLAGKDILKDGTGEVIRLLEERGRLLKEVEVQHKFPYDWRTKKPVIYRASSQWFANLDPVKDAAISALSRVNFFPARGARTLEMYVHGRSEWCISRQRAWGVPIPVVYSSRADGTGREVPYLSPSNIDHIVRVLEAKGQGTDYWWIGEADEFVEPGELERSRREGRVWRKGMDTMDVWFDSGCSWTLLREEGVRAAPEGEARRPLADVYFEGSDQHRGWFQSSLLTKVSSAEAGQEPLAPYRDVVTHGMVLDDKGRKMSKSLGNIVSPSVVIQGGKDKKREPAYGTDLLRVWVASVDSTRDVLIGPGILAQTFEGLRKIRNTARFLLGNLGEEPREEFEVEQLGLIERYILHELYELDRAAREGFSSYQFNKAYQALSTFSNTTLSSFYFDVTKDALYASSTSSLERRQILSVLHTVLETYLSVLAPMAPLLAEEIYHFSKGAKEDPNEDVVGAESVFARVWPEPNSAWHAPELKRDMDELLAVRAEVNGLLEQARNDKRIGSSAEAIITIENPSSVLQRHHEVLKTLFIVSDVSLDSAAPSASSPAWKYETTLPSTGTRLSVLPSPLSKCPRCWQHTVPPPPPPPAEPVEPAAAPVCSRCADVLAERELVAPESTLLGGGTA